MEDGGYYWIKDQTGDWVIAQYVSEYDLFMLMSCLDNPLSIKPKECLEIDEQKIIRMETMVFKLPKEYTDSGDKKRKHNTGLQDLTKPMGLKTPDRNFYDSTT